eukprot:SAG31_NODE_3163_length_4605_cov_15.046383_8_plen_49_part_00
MSSKEKMINFKIRSMEVFNKDLLEYVLPYFKILNLVYANIILRSRKTP